MSIPTVTEEQRNQYYMVNADNTQIRFISGNEQEIVEYQPDKALRIWYNDLDACYPTHWHTSIEIVQPIENYYDLVIDDEKMRIEPGEIAIIPPRAMHEIIAPKEGSRFVYIFDMTAISSIHGFAAIQPVIDSPIRITKATHPHIYHDVCDILTQMRTAYFEQQEFAELSVFALLINLLVKLGTNHFDNLELFSSMRVYKQKEYATKFNEVMEYIDTHYMEDLELDNIAASIGFSKYHFSRLFKQYTGYTFCTYLTRRRLVAAKYLLEQPNLSITEIALQSGFPSISTFNRAFKQMNQCTPSEYRDKMQKMQQNRPGPNAN